MSRAANASFVALLASFAAFPALNVSAEMAADGRQQDRRIVVAGKCLDEDKHELSGAKVRLFRLYRENGRAPIVEIVNATKTAEKGRFRFPDVRAPIEDSDQEETLTHYLVITHPQWATSVSVVNLDQPSENLEVVLQRAGQLDGAVTDDLGLPVAGAVVWKPSVGSEPMDDVWSCVADREGRFAITDLPEWNAKDEQAKPINGKVVLRVTAYSFYIRHPGYGRKIASYSQIPATVDVKLEPGSIIEGLVIDDVSGMPAAGATVQAQGAKKHGWGETQTDEDGRYRLASLVADRYNIWATAPERTVKVVDSFSILAGETKQAPDLRLVSGGFITGRVLHFKSGEPVSRTSEGWRIRLGLYGPSRPTSGAAVESIPIADDGTYRIRAAPGENGPYLQMVGILKRTSRPTPVSVREGETVDLDFYVNPQD